MFRVIGWQETGEEIIVRDSIQTREEAELIASEAEEEHVEWRGCWVEVHPRAQAGGWQTEPKK